MLVVNILQCVRATISRSVKHVKIGTLGGHCSLNYQRFETCREFYDALEMLIFAPIIGAAESLWTDADLDADLIDEIRRVKMIEHVARWGHNALLVGLAVLTYAVFVAAR